MTTDDTGALTGAALNRKIAEARGWTDLHMRYGLVWGCDPDDDSGRVIQPPRWDSNVRAALALCLEICDTKDDLTEVVIFPNGQLSYVELWREIGGGKREKDAVEPFVMPDGLALALARLALAALT